MKHLIQEHLGNTIFFICLIILASGGLLYCKIKKKPLKNETPNTSDNNTGKTIKYLLVYPTLLIILFGVVPGTLLFGPAYIENIIVETFSFVDQNITHDTRRRINELLIDLKDQNPSVRKEAVKILGRKFVERYDLDRNKTWTALEPLVNMLNDNDINVLKETVIVLSEMYSWHRVGPQAIENMLALLKHQDADIRKYAAKALRFTEKKNEKVVKCLIDVLKDEVPDVRNEASESLRWLTSQQFGVDYMKWMQWLEQNKHNFSKTDN